jgi:hypothetical protein
MAGNKAGELDATPQMIQEVENALPDIQPVSVSSAVTAAS